MKLNLTVLKITIIKGLRGHDEIFIKCANPDGCYPFRENELILSFKVAKGEGCAYVKEHIMPINPKYSNLIECITV